MRKIILTATSLFLSSISYAQYFKSITTEITEGLKNKQGTYKTLSDEAVVEKAGSADELYQSAVNWVKETYRSPDDVIVTNIDDHYLRFTGVKESNLAVYVWGSPIYYDVRYTIEFRFRNERFKANIVSYEYLSPPSPSDPRWEWNSVSRNFRVANRKGKKDKAMNWNHQKKDKLFNHLIGEFVNYNPSEENW